MGAGAAKSAARAQEAALQEQIAQAKKAADESARQTAISAANAAARDSASQKVEADTLANKPGEAEVDLSTSTEAPTRKRAKFNTPTGASTITI